MRELFRRILTTALSSTEEEREKLARGGRFMVAMRRKNSENSHADLRSRNAPVNRSAAILAAARWKGAMCFVVGRFGGVEPAVPRSARFMGEGDR